MYPLILPCSVLPSVRLWCKAKPICLTCGARWQMSRSWSRWGENMGKEFVLSSESCCWCYLLHTEMSQEMLSVTLPIFWLVSLGGGWGHRLRGTNLGLVEAANCVHYSDAGFALLRWVASPSCPSGHMLFFLMIMVRFSICWLMQNTSKRPHLWGEHYITVFPRAIKAIDSFEEVQSPSKLLGS